VLKHGLEFINNWFPTQKETLTKKGITMKLILFAPALLISLQSFAMIPVQLRQSATRTGGTRDAACNAASSAVQTILQTECQAQGGTLYDVQFKDCQTENGDFDYKAFVAATAVCG